MHRKFKETMQNSIEIKAEKKQNNGERKKKTN